MHCLIRISSLIVVKKHLTVWLSASSLCDGHPTSCCPIKRCTETRSDAYWERRWRGRYTRCSFLCTAPNCVTRSRTTAPIYWWSVSSICESGTQQLSNDQNTLTTYEFSPAFTDAWVFAQIHRHTRSVSCTQVMCDGNGSMEGQRFVSLVRMNHVYPNTGAQVHHHCAVGAFCFTFISCPYLQRLSKATCTNYRICAN